MLDMIKALQDPVLMEKLTNAPTEILAKLTSIENGVAEILQICKTAEWYLLPNDDGTYRLVAVKDASLLPTDGYPDLATE